MRHILSLALLVAGCSSSSSPAGSSQPPGPGVPVEPGSPWPKFRGGPAQTATSSVHASQQGGAQWVFPTGAGIFSSPIVAADGTVYFGSADRNFYALNPDGTRRWVVATGEIIDSSGLLDDQGRVYFGSGDGFLRAVDAKTGDVAWKFQADDPKKTGGFINWFEGNVAIGPSGTLYVPNDNFLVYALDRASGTVKWNYKMPDQTWSLPAVDVKAGTLYVGNNNLLPILGKNTYSIAQDGTTNWSIATLGTVAASPMILPDGNVVVGGFDGYTRAFAQADGTVLWQLATRDHIYASPAALPDGTVVQPSADGTIYAVSPSDGSVRWTFDAGTPIRSSPAVDADGHVYVGGGDGNLYVVNPDGTLRFAMKLISEERNDLNSSPALGQDAVYLGGESGQMFSVPYDWCLRSANAGDARCTTKSPTRTDGASLSWVGTFGDTLAAPPSSVPGNAPITLLFGLRDKGVQQLSILDPSSVQVSVTPSTPVSVDVSGDGKFLSITPTVAFPAGPLKVTVHGSYLVNLQRKGLRLSGGQAGGTVDASFSTTVSSSTGGKLDPTATYEVTRLSIPLPTVLPSYNQIGFDQLHYLLGTVAMTGSTGLAWMVGGVLPPGKTASIVDPTTQAIIPMAFDVSGDLVTMNAASGIQVTVTSFTLPFQSFRLALGFTPGGAASGTAELTGSAICGQIGFYGPFLQQLGLCNPQTDVIRVLGAANTARRTDLPAVPAAGMVSFASTSGGITATVTGSAVKPTEHLVGLLAADATSGQPVPLQYGTGTQRNAAADGTIASVTVPTKGVKLPAKMNVYLMIDTTVGAHGSL
jgi:outer membrane protein assembly factor BamB